MKREIVTYTLRTDMLLLRKLRYIAVYEGRSTNRQICHILKRHVAKFEEKHGEIVFSSDEES